MCKNLRREKLIPWEQLTAMRQRVRRHGAWLPDGGDKCPLGIVGSCETVGVCVHIGHQPLWEKSLRVMQRRLRFAETAFLGLKVWVLIDLFLPLTWILVHPTAGIWSARIWNCTLAQTTRTSSFLVICSGKSDGCRLLIASEREYQMLLKDLESWFVCDEQFFFVLLARGGCWAFWCEVVLYLTMIAFQVCHLNMVVGTSNHFKRVQRLEGQSIQNRSLTHMPRHI